MERVIKDADFLNFLPTESKRKRYLHFKERITPIIEDVAACIKTEGVSVAMEKFDMSEREAVLLKRLGYLLPDEVTQELIDMDGAMPL